MGYWARYLKKQKNENKNIFKKSYLELPPAVYSSPELSAVRSKQTATRPTNAENTVLRTVRKFTKR